MENRKLLNFKYSTIIFLIISTTLLLIYSLGIKEANKIIVYFSYLYSSFSLVVVIYNTKRFSLYLKTQIKETKIYVNYKNKIYKNKYIKRYFIDIRYKNLINLSISSTINLCFILINFINGVSSKSFWFISISLYYFILTIVKIILFTDLKNHNNKYRNIGYFILLLNIVLVIMIVQLVRTKVPTINNEYLVYLNAIYSFYLIISAVINVIKYRKLNNTLLSYVKIINLLAASFSILMLQTTMISTFSKDEFIYMSLMNALTGSAVSIFSIVVSLYMIIRTHKNWYMKEVMGYE